MNKETNNAFNNDNLYEKLLKYILKSKTKGYESFNVVSETGDSIYSPTIKEEDHVFVSVDSVRKIIDEELGKRLGPSIKNKDDD